MNILRHTLSIACTAVLFAACDNTPKFEASGTINEAAGKMIYLEVLSLEGPQAVDSMKIGKDGSFSFRQPAPSCPEFYSLRIDRQRINFSVDSTESITFEAALPTMDTKYSVTGSTSSQKIHDIVMEQQAIQKRVVAIEKNKALLPGVITDSIRNLLNAYKEKVKETYLYVDPLPAAAYYAVSQSITDLEGTFQLFSPTGDRSDVKCYAIVANMWDAYWPDAPRTQQLVNMAELGMARTAKPREKKLELDSDKVKSTGLIDVELPDANSELRSLSSLRGKVVLLDFTMFSGKGSDKRTRVLRSLYSKYHDRGFEIYQVSLDDDLHFWQYSVENLPWISVHETDGTATRLYAAEALPTFFLINRENEVVKRNTAIKNLEAEIEALL